MKCHHCEKVFKGKMWYSKCSNTNNIFFKIPLLSGQQEKINSFSHYMFIQKHASVCRRVELDPTDQNAASGITSLPGAEEHAFSNLMVLLTLPLSTDCI